MNDFEDNTGEFMFTGLRKVGGISKAEFRERFGRDIWEVYGAILSAKNSREARKGALLGALLIPPVGILSILVGYFMMARYPTIDPAQAFPLFVVNCLPPPHSEGSSSRRC